MTENGTGPSVKWSPRNVMLATLFVILVILGFWLLYRFSSVVVILFVAILLGTGINPAVAWLERRRVPRMQGEILVYVVILFLVVAFVLLIVPIILEQSTALTAQISEYYARFRIFLFTSRSQILARIGFQLPPELNLGDLFQSPGGQTPGTSGDAKDTVNTVSQLFRVTGLVAQGIFYTIGAFLMAFYWTLEGDRAIRTLLLLLPLAHRENVKEIIEMVQAKLGGFIFGQAILCLIIAVFSLISFLIIGLPNALVLALIAGVLEALPTIGPVLGAVPAVLVAASTDPSKVIWVILSTVIIQQLENNLLVPRVMDRSVGVHPLLTMLFLAALTSLLGILGAVLAVPLAAIFQYLTNRFIFSPMREKPIDPEGRDQLSYLRLRAQEIIQDTRKRGEIRPITSEVGEDGEPPAGSEKLEEAIEALASDLDQFLAQAVAVEKGSQ